MEQEQFTNITTQIAQNLNNQALVTNLLTQLNDGYTTVYGTLNNIQKQNENYEKEIKTLQDTNMQLFLKVSNPKPQEVTKPSEGPKLEDVVKSIEGVK